MNRFHRLVLTAVLALSYVPRLAAAQRSFGCQHVWTDASPSNDFQQCLNSRSPFDVEWLYFFYLAFPAALFLFTIFVLPFAFMGHCGVTYFRCCSRRNKSSNITRTRCWLWSWITVVLILGISTAALMLAGTYYAVWSTSQALNDIGTYAVRYFLSTKEEVLDLVGSSGTAGNLAAFEHVTNDIQMEVDQLRVNYHVYFRIVAITTYCLAGISLVLLLLLVLLALSHCSGLFPSILSGFYWFFAIVYAFLSELMIVVIYVVGAWCGEVTLQYRREPGYFQWSVVPRCQQKQYNFDQPIGALEAFIRQASTEACTQLLKYCDTETNYTYETESYQQIYICSKILSAASGCSDLGGLMDATLNTVAKPSINNLMCQNTTGWNYQESCNVIQCSERCIDYEPILKILEWTTSVANLTEEALRANTAIALISPMKDCNFIVDNVVSNFETEIVSPSFTGSRTTVNTCSDLYLTSWMLGVAFFIGSIAFVIGILVLHKGSVMWSDKAKKLPRSGKVIKKKKD